MSIRPREVAEFSLRTVMDPQHIQPVATTPFSLEGPALGLKFSLDGLKQAQPAEVIEQTRQVLSAVKPKPIVAQTVQQEKKMAKFLASLQGSSTEAPAEPPAPSQKMTQLSAYADEVSAKLTAAEGRLASTEQQLAKTSALLCSERQAHAVRLASLRGELDEAKTNETKLRRELATKASAPALNAKIFQNSVQTALDDDRRLAEQKKEIEALEKKMELLQKAKANVTLDVEKLVAFQAEVRGKIAEMEAAAEKATTEYNSIVVKRDDALLRQQNAEKMAIKAKADLEIIVSNAKSIKLKAEEDMEKAKEIEADAEKRIGIALSEGPLQPQPSSIDAVARPSTPLPMDAPPAGELINLEPTDGPVAPAPTASPITLSDEDRKFADLLLMADEETKLDEIATSANALLRDQPVVENLLDKTPQSCDATPAGVKTMCVTGDPAPVARVNGTLARLHMRAGSAHASLASLALLDGHIGSADVGAIWDDEIAAIKNADKTQLMVDAVVRDLKAKLTEISASMTHMPLVAPLA